MTAIPEHPLYPPYRQPMLEADGTVTRPWLLYFESLNTNVSNIVNPVTGVVTHTGALVNNELVIGNGSSDVKPLGSTGTVHQVLHGNAAGAPAFSGVDLAADVGVTIAPPANGGTGASGVPTNGQIPIGNGTVYVPAMLTAGAGVSVTNGAGSVTIASTIAPIFAVEVTLTHTQILALPTTGVTMLGAPGVGIFTKVIGVTYIANTSAGAYTNLNASYVDLHMTLGSYFASYGPVDDSTVTPPLTLVTGLLGTAGQTILEVGQPAQASPTGGSPPEYVLSLAAAGAGSANQALMLFATNSGSGNFTGGNSANTLKVYVLYQGISL